MNTPEIQRYDGQFPLYGIHPREAGKYVLHSDHAAAIQKLEQDNASLLKTITDIRFAIGDDGKAMLSELPGVVGRMSKRMKGLEKSLRETIRCIKCWSGNQKHHEATHAVLKRARAALAGKGENP